MQSFDMTQAATVDVFSSGKIASCISLQFQWYIIVSSKCLTVSHFCRCLLNVFSDVSVLLRLNLSDPSVYCSFKIIDSYGNYVENTTGIGHIIIPVIKLEGNYHLSLYLPVCNSYFIFILIPRKEYKALIVLLVKGKLRYLPFKEVEVR